MTGEVFLRWQAEDAPEVAPGVRALVKFGDAVEIGRISVSPGTTLKEHAHSEEQFFYILSGRLRYWIGDLEDVAGPGDLVHMPSGVTHRGVVEGDETAVFIEVKERLRGRKGRGQ